MVGISILALVIAVAAHEGFSFRVVEFPWPFSRYILYMLFSMFVLISFIIQFGLRGVDMDHTRFSYHHIHQAVESYIDGNYDAVFHHISELHEDVENTNNDVFSKKTEDAISDLYESLDESEMTESIVEDRFENLAVIFVEEIEFGEALDRQTSKMKNENEFERSVVRDAAQNMGIRPLQVAPFVVVAISAGVYFYVNKDAGYAVGMLLLSALGATNRS